MNQLPNQFITSSTNINQSNKVVSNPETSNLKLTLVQSYFLRNLPFSTSLYTSNSNLTSALPQTQNEINTSLVEGTVRNFFTPTSFTDLLQQSDLQALNTVNASTNAASKLYLNCNYSNINFKS